MEVFEEYLAGLKEVRPDIFAGFLGTMPLHVSTFAATYDHSGRSREYFQRVISHLKEHPQGFFSSGKMTVKPLTLFQSAFCENVLSGAYDKDFSKQAKTNKPHPGDRTPGKNYLEGFE